MMFFTYTSLGAFPEMKFSCLQIKREETLSIILHILLLLSHTHRICVAGGLTFSHHFY